MAATAFGTSGGLSAFTVGGTKSGANARGTMNVFMSSLLRFVRSTVAYHPATVPEADYRPDRSIVKRLTTTEANNRGEGQRRGAEARGRMRGRGEAGRVESMISSRRG